MSKKLCLLLLGLVLLNVICGCSKNEGNDDSLSNIQENNMINLNDNVEVTMNTISTGTENCFFYMFVDNLLDVFPNVQIKKSNQYCHVAYWPGLESDGSAGEITEEGLTKNMSSVTFLEEKENAIIQLFKQYQSNPYAGVGNISYSLTDHRLSFSYDYLEFANEKYEFYGKTFNNDIQHILESATRFDGPCGGFDATTNAVLTENLCTEYHLNCGRW